MNKNIPLEAYEIYTRNNHVRDYLTLMFDKYGIRDYALSTETSWSISPLEIYPVRNIPLEKSLGIVTLESIDELVLYQFNRLENELINNPIDELDENNDLDDFDHLLKKESYFKNLNNGFSYLYLVKEEKPVKSFKIFQGFLGDGVNGLCISRMHPDQLSNHYGVNTENIIWLCHTDGKNNIDPKDLSELVARINNFIKEHGNSVILLDGLEYLISHNGLDKIINILNTIRSQVDMDSMFILPIHPKALRKNDFEQLEKTIVHLCEK